MNIRKLAIVAAAIAINVLVLAWFHAWTVSDVASATPPPPPNGVITLPTVNVHPSAQQWQLLHRSPASASSRTDETPSHANT
ncbi:MAG TPA: hypothetical protein VF292_14510 [Rhodanobacteraceae bacterium]